jgi:hypothetical protein
MPFFCSAQANERYTLPVDKKAKFKDLATSKDADDLPELPGPFTVMI